MTMMDERVAARRRGVSEDRARRRLRIVLVVLAIVLLGVVAAWLIRSPVLSVSTVEISGAERSNPSAVVDELGYGVGTPTMDVRADAIRRDVEADPWVATADVSVRWPGTISIAVVEHTPLVPALNEDAWFIISASGAVLSPAEPPAPGDTAIAIDLAGVPVGASTEDPMVIGAAAFVEALEPDLRMSVVLRVEDGSLMARIPGYDVRLGRPTEMYEKAVVLGAMLEQDLAVGSTIDLIAPSRPAVSNPQPLEEAEE